MKKVQFTSAAEFIRTGKRYTVLTEEEASKTCFFGMGHAECSTCQQDVCPWYAEIEEEAQR
jgi:hypothetical protein